MGLIKPVDAGSTSIPASQKVNALNDVQQQQAAVANKPTITPEQPVDSFGGVANPAEQQAVQNTAAASAPDQVDWNNMSQDQKYDYLHKLTEANAGGKPDAWKTGDKEVNLVGVRGFADGEANANEKDKYNDTIFACRMNNGQKEVYEFKASTDPGADPSGKWHDKGDAFLADGFYKDTWSKGKVSGGEQGLRQADWVNVQVDANGDGKISGTEAQRKKGGTDCQFQFHRGGDGDSVGKSSAGCQVIQDQQYDDFQKLLSEAPDSQKFSYLLVNGDKLPADPNGTFAKCTGSATKGVGDANGHGCYDRFVPAKLRKGIEDQNDRYAGLGAVDPVDDPEFDEQRPWLDGDGGIGVIQTPIKAPTAPTAPKPTTSSTLKG